MAPADRYIVRQIEEGTPSNYSRVITYTPNGAEKTEDWLIHLQVEPLHAAEEGYVGTGDEVIQLFYANADDQIGDTWNACEQAIGVTIDNPLESIDWINKTGYFGMESVAPSTPVTHVKATAYATHSTDRDLGEISVTAGYNKGNVQITISATVAATAGTITTGGITRGYATFEHDTTTIGSGAPVLIVTTNETNNLGYYNGDYFDPTAYWVKDNVFYTLRVFGDEVDQAEIQETLELILAEI